MYNRVVACFKSFQTKDINNYHIEYSITGNGRFSHEGSKLVFMQAPVTPSNRIAYAGI